MSCSSRCSPKPGMRSGIAPESVPKPDFNSGIVCPLQIFLIDGNRLFEDRYPRIPLRLVTRVRDFCPSRAGEPDGQAGDRLAV
jgi:hypothetical protein